MTRTAPNPSWGTITREGHGQRIDLVHLLTPHGERLPPDVVARLHTEADS